MSAGRQLAHRIPLLVVKAGFSSLPLAVLAFDVIREVVDFGNAHLTDRFLENVGARLERLEQGEHERLKADPIHQLSGRVALQRLLTETNPRMSDALARAVAELSTSGLPDIERMEIARALDALTEPALHLLQTMYRAHNDQLTQQELGLVNDNVREPYHFTMLMYASMQLSSWIASANELERAGMVAATLDDGWPNEEERAAREPLGEPVHLRLIYPLGERIVRMCFEDPSVPAFGFFEPEVGRGNGENAHDA